MRTSLAGTAAAAAAVSACLSSTASAWVVNTGQNSHIRSFPIALAAAAVDDDADGNSNSSTDDDARQPQSSEPDIVNIDNVEPQAVYGVSYIGGDPCGSKYNDDPFDAAAQITKPGMPDDAKERIRLLAEKMKRKE